MQVAFEGGLLEIGDPDRNPDLPWPGVGRVTGPAIQTPSGRVPPRPGSDQCHGKVRQVQPGRYGRQRDEGAIGKAERQDDRPGRAGARGQVDHQVSV